jgi:hypothetical protein
MRQIYKANFTSQSVAILTPVLVFLAPFAVFSIAMQWDFSSEKSFDIFYGLFFGGVIWFLVCVAACLCISMPSKESSEDPPSEISLRRYVKKFSKFFLIFFLISISLMLTHRYDLSAKKERYEVVHKKFCELDLSQPLLRLMRTHDNYGQIDQKHLGTSLERDHYLNALEKVSGWMDSTKWDTTVVIAEKDSFSLISTMTDYLPIQKKSVLDSLDIGTFSDPLSVPLCRMVRVDGRWKSLRTFFYEGQKPTVILTRVREQKSRY